MRFASSLMWPTKLPELNDYAGWSALDRMTHGREVEGVELVDVELRARRQLYRFRLPPGGLQGSQFKGTWRYPYYVELFAHEMGHLLHLGFKLPDIKDGTKMLLSALDELTRDEGDENEVEAAATATLVIESMGLPYTLQYLLSSTVTNLRNRPTRTETFEMIKEQRMHPKTRQIARQITHHLLKMKHAEDLRSAP